MITLELSEDFVYKSGPVLRITDDDGNESEISLEDMWDAMRDWEEKKREQQHDH